jgi:hypothetical protein
MRRADLIREGYEVLKNAENYSLEQRVAAAETARAFAKLAEALGDGMFIVRQR